VGDQTSTCRHRCRSRNRNVHKSAHPRERSQALGGLCKRYRILDTAYEALFDEIAAVAAKVCGTPMSAVSLVDAERQWFKARVGLKVAETTRDLAFCAHAIMDPAHFASCERRHD